MLAPEISTVSAAGTEAGTDVDVDTDVDVEDVDAEDGDVEDGDAEADVDACVMGRPPCVRPVGPVPDDPAIRCGDRTTVSTGH
ncbi:hypothetical protein ACH4VR_21430 [Streptomyces sp. NPDC020883]|uniref:hypothetical protein n=1 Tax=Streptomyces sp. NPDC020883 TaxID=3365099 RepID=UPI003792501D